MLLPLVSCWSSTQKDQLSEQAFNFKMANHQKSSKNASQHKNGTLATLYLVSYNIIQVLGWSYLLYQTFDHLVLNKDAHKGPLYDKVATTLIIFQNLAILEVLHAALRLVSSSIQVTVQQIASRVIVVCGVLMIAKTPRESVGFIMLLFAWCFAEIIRYANYAFNLVTKVPYFLLYLRYTAFLILYPIGVSGELLTMYWTYQEAKTMEFRVAGVNLFKYYPYVILGVMLLYIPLFPQMFYYMVKQRRKQLGAPTATTKKEQ